MCTVFMHTLLLMSAAAISGSMVPISFFFLLFFSGSKFVALVIPSGPGAMFDLASNQYLAGILNAFIRESSK